MKLHTFLFSFIILTITSCGIYPTTSVFPIDRIHLGASESDIRLLCGTPFRSDKFKRNNKTVDILYYKEGVRVQTTDFIVTTRLTFENDSLVSIIQDDKMPAEMIVDSIRKR